MALIFPWKLIIIIILCKEVYMLPNAVVDDVSVKNVSSCEEGWKQYDQNCFKLVHRLRKWRDAGNECKNMGGNLASIHSKEETDFLEVFTLENGERFYWIGLHDQAMHGVYEWNDETDVDYANWRHNDGMVYSPGDNCVLVDLRHSASYPFGTWSTTHCSRVRYSFLCRKNIATSVIASSVSDIETKLTSSFSTTVTNANTIYRLPNTAVHDVSVKDLSSCGEGWKQYDQNCFMLVPVVLNWTDAIYICNNLGGNLASIHSNEQTDFLEDLNPDNKKMLHWIGLHDHAVEGVFAWNDETDLDYSNWKPGEPKGLYSDGKCVAVTVSRSARFSFGMWLVARCNLRYPFLCQKKIATSVIASSVSDIETKSTSSFLPTVTNAETIYMLPNTTVDDVSVKDLSPCEEGWKQYDQNCFKLVPVVLNWTHAIHICNILGGNLASIHSNEQTDFLQDLNPDNDKIFHWIGLHDHAVEGVFAWNDETDFDYTNWGAGEPKGRYSDGKCVAVSFVRSSMFPFGKWLVARCNLRYPFLCQKKISTSAIERTVTDKETKSTSAYSTAVTNTETTYMLINTDVDDVSVKDLSACEDGWEQHDENCFKLQGPLMNWTAAIHKCNNLGGNLASIHSKEQNEFLEDLLTHTIYWIGLNDHAVEGVFAWNDESDVDYINWGPNEPNGFISKGKCVALSTLASEYLVSGKWFAFPCNAPFAFLCQKKKTTSVVATTVTDKETKSTSAYSTSVANTETIYMLPNAVVDDASVKNVSSCEEGWKEYDQNCFKLVHRLKNWRDASNECKNMGGNLASIHSKEQSDFLGYFALENGERFYWIGLHDRAVHCGYVWNDETDLDYTNWKSNAGMGYNSPGETCAVVDLRHFASSPFGGWFIAHCSSILYPFLCQKKKTSVISSSVTDNRTIYMHPNTAVDDVSVKNLSSCEEDWIQYDQNFFKLVRRPYMNWTDAIHECNTLGGNLASIHSKEQNDFLVDFALKDVHMFYWIGLHDHAVEGVFAWNDETDVDYTKWRRNEPKGNFPLEGKCVAVNILPPESFYSGTWLAFPCDDHFPFLCQKKLARSEVSTAVTDKETSYFSVAAFVITLIAVIALMTLMGGIIYYKKHWLEHNYVKILFRKNEQDSDPSTECVLKPK